MVALAAVTLSARAEAREAPSREDLKRIQRFIKERMRQEPTAGLSVAFYVFVGDKPFTWVKGFGYRDRAQKLRATPTTSYRFASVTKPMTAVAALQLVERKKLDLDARVQKYLPDFPKKPWKVTTRQLLGHLAGISHYRDCFRTDECKKTTKHTTEESLAIFRDWPLVAKPGTKWVYSSYGFNVVGAVVEKVSGRGYGDYLARSVFRPARMKTARMDVLDEEVPERAVGYRLRGKWLGFSDVVDVSSRFAGGGTRGTVKDMLAFARALRAGKLLRPSTVDLMETAMVKDDGELTDYGMGIGVYPHSGRFVAAHSGGQPETTTLLYMLPGERFAIALASNVEGQGALLRSIVEEVVTVVLGDGTARRQPIGDDLVSNAIARGLTGLYGHGRAHYTRFGVSAAKGPGDLIRAFERVGQLLSPSWITRDPALARREVQLGDDPIGGRVYTKVGGHMAGVISNVFGRAHLDTYPATGAIPFVLDYARACRLIDCPVALRFPDEALRYVQEAGPAWALANAEEVRSFRVTSETTPAALEAKLAEAFSEAVIHPDLSPDILKVARPRIAKGDVDGALALLTVGAQLHPRSSSLALALAEAALAKGDLVAGKTHLDRWATLNDDDDNKREKILRARARTLNRHASAASAAALLEWAAAQYPESEKMQAQLARAKKRAERPPKKKSKPKKPKKPKKR